jgi:hypothetical protein
VIPAPHIVISGTRARPIAHVADDAPGRTYSALFAVGFTWRPEGFYALHDQQDPHDAARSLRALLVLADATAVEIELPDRPYLGILAARIAERLPGTWTVNVEQYTERVWQGDLLACLWESAGVLGRALTDQRVPRSAILTSDDRTELIITERPGHPCQLLIGALAAHGVAHAFAGDPAAPNSIHTPADPARAAHRIARRLLPRYRDALHALRTDQLAEALDIGQRELDAWEAISDSLCDTDGVPLDDDTYGLRQSQRDAGV